MGDRAKVGPRKVLFGHLCRRLVVHKGQVGNAVGQVGHNLGHDLASPQDTNASDDCATHKLVSRGQLGHSLDAFHQPRPDAANYDKDAGQQGEDFAEDSGSLGRAVGLGHRGVVVRDGFGRLEVIVGTPVDRDGFRCLEFKSLGLHVCPIAGPHHFKRVPLLKFLNLSTSGLAGSAMSAMSSPRVGGVVAVTIDQRGRILAVVVLRN